MVRAGNWLSRWRSYLPLLVLALVIGSLTSFEYPRGSHTRDRAWELFCFSVSLLGLAVRSLAVGHASRGTSGRDTRCPVAERLNTTGMYSIVRHPLYLGNFLIWSGVGLFPREWWLTLVVLLVFALYYERIMFAEEEFLRDRFGDAFLEWAERTPAFIPKLSLWKPPDLPFSVRTVLKREYSGFFGIIATFTALEVLGDYAAAGRWEIDPLWAALFGAGALAYLTLRFLKRKTRVLDVEGR